MTLTILMLLALTALWMAAGYRIIVAIQRPATRRSEFALWIGFTAVAATGYAVRPQLDEAVGVPNITNLGSRIALCVAIAAGQLFLRDARTAASSSRYRRIVLTAAVTTAAVSVAAWLLAPLHEMEHLDLATAGPKVATLVYAVTIYIYAAWATVDTTIYVSRNLDLLRRTDPPAALAAHFVRASGWTGVPVLILWAAHVSLAQFTGTPDPYLERASAVLFPISLALMGIGLLMIPVIPMLRHRQNARQLSDSLHPLWETLLAQHPEVQLRNTAALLPVRLAPRIAAQRRLIEISDALEVHTVPTVTSVSALATALRSPHTADGTQTAKDALVSVDEAPWPEPILHLSKAISLLREQSHAR